mmetsp:Transcript_30017/g.49580  ORF Transcript_30017/g.49580 Transcript_30017/m.49580 type:complete len:469 (+) Transcript_30017:77-1483(+)
MRLLAVLLTACCVLAEGVDDRRSTQYVSRRKNRHQEYRHHRRRSLKGIVKNDTPTPAPMFDFSRAIVVPPPVAAPSSSPSLSSIGIRRLIASVAIWGGLEFIWGPGYQSKALWYLENVLSPVSSEEYVIYYVLACIYYASTGVRNGKTDSMIPVDPKSLEGWLSSDNWVTDSDKCTWYGITCNAANQVIGIDLPDNQMLGLFAPETQLLGDTLEVLDLSGNLFLSTEYDNGNSWMAKMTQLRKLLVAETSFGYNGIPVYFNGMVALEELDISNTFFTGGPIRGEAFEGLTNLRYLDMSCNVYTSTVPSIITNLPNLEYFYLENVEFAGVTQSLNFLVDMPSIKECWVDKTLFEGGIPSELGTMTTLTSFSASDCGLYGPLPSGLGNMQAMNRIWLYENELTGSIPTELSNLQQLKFLSVEGNRLTGEFPDEVCSVESLQSIGADCDSGSDNFVVCPCCTCCGVAECKG